MMTRLHHPSCPARDGGACCVCPAAEVDCPDCGGVVFHAIACVFWDDHCTSCAAPLVSGSCTSCEPAAAGIRPLGAAAGSLVDNQLRSRLADSWGREW